jgi:hypothetical protein
MHIINWAACTSYMSIKDTPYRTIQHEYEMNNIINNKESSTDTGNRPHSQHRAIT